MTALAGGAAGVKIQEHKQNRQKDSESERLVKGCQDIGDNRTNNLFHSVSTFLYNEKTNQITEGYGLFLLFILCSLKEKVKLKQRFCVIRIDRKNRKSKKKTPKESPKKKIPETI